MLNKLTIRNRIQFGCAVVLILGVLLLLWTVLQTLDEQLQRSERDTKEYLQQAAQDEIRSQQNRALSLSAAIAQQPGVQRAFANRDRDRLRDELLPVFAYLKENGLFAFEGVEKI